MSINPIFKSKNVIIWATLAKTGERMIYAHRAHSAAEAIPDLSYTEAYKAHCMGLVFLSQRRCERGWDYEATRISSQTAKLLGLGPNNRGPEL